MCVCVCVCVCVEEDSTFALGYVEFEHSLYSKVL